MTPGINFKSLSYNPFGIHESSINSERDPDINFYQDISSLETHYCIVCFSETWVDDISFSKNSNFQQRSYIKQEKIVRDKKFVFLYMEILASN